MPTTLEPIDGDDEDHGTSRGPGSSPRPQRLRMSTSYWGTGLWYDGGPGVGPLEPETLGLSPELMHDIAAWQEHFDAHAGTGDGWDSSEAESWNARTGRLLVERLREELGGTVQVTVAWEASADEERRHRMAVRSLLQRASQPRGIQGVKRRSPSELTGA